MELTYNGVALHELGEVTISQSTEYEGGETPVRAKRTLRVVLEVFEDTFASNYALVTQAKAALKVQHGVLLWRDAETETVFVNQTAVVESENLPDDPNGWGRYHQRLEIVFTFYEQDLTTERAAVTLAYAAGNIELAQMTEWKETVEVTPFDPLRPQQKFAVVTVQASGLELADTKLTLTQRRAALHAKRDVWRSRVTGQNETTLTCGTFSRAMRVQRFEAEVNQAENAIGWNFAAYYNVLPAEGGYAIAEYRVTERNGDNQPATGTGEQFLTISGTVKASSEALALSKINEIQAAQLTARAYAAGEITRHEIDDSRATGGTVKDGDFFIERTFTIELRKWRSDNQTLTLQKTGTSAVVNFGQVREFTDGYNARRFNEQRSQRSLAQGRIEFSGTLWLGSATTSVGQRRSLLTQRVREMHDAVNGADGRLIFGSYLDATVRVEDFQPRVNQKLTGIDWTLSCTYSKFPNETGFATVEMQADQAEDNESGDATLVLSGVIRATSETIARAKLASARTAALTLYGYTAKQQKDVRSTVSTVSANGDKTAALAAVELADGTTFIELQFSETYRKRMSSVLSWGLTVSDAGDERAGFITTTYSGEVTATSYETALEKAQELGDGKFPFRVRNDVTWVSRQTREDADTEFVNLRFSYEYQRKDGAKAYVEIISTTTTSTFGNDTETIAGFVSAADLATAQGHYQTLVKDALAARLVLDEDVTSGTQRKQGETDFGTPQFTRLEFRVSVYKRRATGGAALRYAIDTERDWLTLTQRTTVSGTCYAATRKEAENEVIGFLGTLGLGSPVRSREGVQLMKRGSLEELGQYDFEEVFEARMGGATAILSCELTQELEHSGTRWVEQPLPLNADGSGGVSLFQNCGVQPGRRTLRGVVEAPTLLLARQWAHSQRALLGGTIELPPSMNYTYVFAPRVQGVASGTGQNVQLFRVTFTFSEWLPENPYAAPA